MANLEFPKNISSSTNTMYAKENTESINKTSKANTDKIIKAIQIAMIANAQATADEWYKKDRAKDITKLGVEQKLDKIGNNIKKSVSPITKGLKEVGERVVDSTKSAISDTYTEVFGSGALAETIKSTIGVTLKKINDSLVNIGGWLLKHGGKWLKNILVYSVLFFSWLKKFLMKSMLFKAIGGIAKMAWGGITSTLNLGGDLLGSIAKQLVGKASADALLGGIKNMVKGVSGAAFMGAIAKVIGGSLLAAGFGAALGYGLGNMQNSHDAGMAASRILRGEGDNKDRATVAAYLGNNRKNLTDKEIELFEKALSQYDEKNIGNLNNFTKLSDQLKSHGWDISSTSTEQLYNDLLKLFPKEGKSAGLEKGWFNSDKNKDGFKDYDIDRYHKLLHEIYKTNQDGLPQSVVEELKRKSTLKNAAGVSST